MKILQVCQSFYPCFGSGGVVKSAYELSKRLVEHGHQVTVYTSDGCLNGNNKQASNVKGIQVYYLKNLIKKLKFKFKLSNPYYLPFLARQDIKQYDIIHIHEYRSFLAIIIHYYAQKYRIPYVLQARGSVRPFFQKITFKKVFDYLWGYKILEDAHRVLALTSNEVKEYEMMGVDSTKISIVPNGIDTSICTKVEKGRFRKKLDLNKDTKIILYLGRIHKIKGLDLLLEAFHELIKDFEDLKLIIIGPDDGYLEHLKSLVKLLQLETHVMFPGPLYNQEKMEAYKDADLYVLPSYYEVFGNTVLEACACGTPVVVTDRCGISEFVDEFGYVTSYNKDSLKKAMKKILENDLSGKKTGNELQKSLKKQFDQEEIVYKIEKIYREII